MKERWNFDFN